MSDGDGEQDTALAMYCSVCETYPVMIGGLHVPLYRCECGTTANSRAYPDIPDDWIESAVPLD